MQSNPAVLTVVTAAPAGRDLSRQNGSADAVACEMSDRSSCSGFNMDADRCALHAVAICFWLRIPASNSETHHGYALSV